LAQWQKLGITRINGRPFPRPGDKAQLFAPEGKNGPAFLILNNFRSILRYNNAKSYALAVGHLADRLAGYDPFVQPWPTGENRLSLEQRMELQSLLVAAGHLEGDVDGIVGSVTLEGVRSYQRAKSMPVDGYPTLTILKRLRKEAPPPPPPVQQPAVAAEQVASPQAASPTAASPKTPPSPQPAAAQPAAPAAQQPAGAVQKTVPAPN